MRKLIQCGIIKGTKIINDTKDNQLVNKIENDLKILDGCKNGITYKKIMEDVT